MLDSILHAKNDAINILKHDHDTVKGLFEDFKKAKGVKARRKIVEKALNELQVHAAIEENLFYPAVRQKLEKDMMNEANEEHHVAKILIAELSQMNGTEEHHDAKFTVLAENIKHHIKEEEGQMFPKVRSLDVDLRIIGDELLVRKQQLKVRGVPKSAEEKLMTKANVRKSDSPALTALALESKKKKPAGQKTAGKKSRKTA